MFLFITYNVVLSVSQPFFHFLLHIHISSFLQFNIFLLRYGYFVFEQPRALDYKEEGGPTDACSPQMSNGRGPFKSTKNFMRKYGLKLTAATFVILDTNEASMEVRKFLQSISFQQRCYSINANVRPSVCMSVCQVQGET